MLLPSSSVFQQAEEQIFRLPPVGIMKQSSTYKPDIFLDLCIIEPAPPVAHRKNASENIKQNDWLIYLFVINLNASCVLENRGTGYVNNQLEIENPALSWDNHGNIFVCLSLLSAVGDYKHCFVHSYSRYLLYLLSCMWCNGILHMSCC